MHLAEPWHCVTLEGRFQHLFTHRFDSCSFLSSSDVSLIEGERLLIELGKGHALHLDVVAALGICITDLLVPLLKSALWDVLSFELHSSTVFDLEFLESEILFELLLSN